MIIANIIFAVWANWIIIWLLMVADISLFKSRLFNRKHLLGEIFYAWIIISVLMIPVTLAAIVIDVWFPTVWTSL